MRQKRNAGSSYIAIISIAILVLPAFLFAQDVTEPSLKAAYILNLVKFTEWPAEPSGVESFVICVFGDSAVRRALEESLKGQLHAGRIITVVRVTTANGPQPACRVLYASGAAREILQILPSLRGTPVLTISDIEGFIEWGGIVQFFFEDGQLRFNIGLESAKAAHLQISAKILTLAKRK